MMRRAAIASLFCLLAVPLATSARQAKVARPSLLVADVDLVEYAPLDQRYDQAEDAARAAMLSQRIRAAVSASGHYRVLDRSKADRTPPYRYLNCKACISTGHASVAASLCLSPGCRKRAD